MSPKKECSCGCTMFENERTQNVGNDPFDGFYGECVRCHSTLFIPLNDGEEAEDEQY